MFKLYRSLYFLNEWEVARLYAVSCDSCAEDHFWLEESHNRITGAGPHMKRFVFVVIFCALTASAGGYASSGPDLPAEVESLAVRLVSKFLPGAEHVHAMVQKLWDLWKGWQWRLQHILRILKYVDWHPKLENS